MELATGIVLLLIIGLIWALFVEGWLWKIILFFAGWFGIFVGLSIYVPESKATVMIFDCPVSWAAVVATGICLMALLTTKVKNS